MLAEQTITPTVLLDLVEWLPLDAALWRAISTDALWTLTDHLLAGVVDVLRTANWQRAGDRRVPQPEPLTRPGVGVPLDVVTGDAMTLEQTDEWLRSTDPSWNRTDTT